MKYSTLSKCLKQYTYEVLDGYRGKLALNLKYKTHNDKYISLCAIKSLLA